MQRKCHICGKTIVLPYKMREKDIKICCPSCGAEAELMIKKRNRMVKGLRGCFSFNR